MRRDLSLQSGILYQCNLFVRCFLVNRLQIVISQWSWSGVPFIISDFIHEANGFSADVCLIQVCCCVCFFTALIIVCWCWGSDSALNINHETPRKHQRLISSCIKHTQTNYEENSYDHQCYIFSWSFTCAICNHAMAKLFGYVNDINPPQRSLQKSEYFSHAHMNFYLNYRLSARHKF